MHAEPDPVPAGAGDKFPIDFGGPGLGSGSSMAEGSPGSCCHPRAGKSSCCCPGVLWDCVGGAWPWSRLGIFCVRFLQRCKWLTWYNRSR